MLPTQWGVLLPWFREERTTSDPQGRRESPPGGGWGWDRVGRGVPTRSQHWEWDGHGEGHWLLPCVTFNTTGRCLGPAWCSPAEKLDLGLWNSLLTHWMLSWIPAHQSHLSSALQGLLHRWFRSWGGSRSSGGISALVTWPSLLGIPLMPSAINCKFLTHKAKRKRQDWDSGESPRDTAGAAPRWM